MKKPAYINGTVQLPLKVGCRAVIRLSYGDYTYTSTVVAITQVSEHRVQFDTLHSTYIVSTGPRPDAAFRHDGAVPACA